MKRHATTTVCRLFILLIALTFPSCDMGMLFPEIPVDDPTTSITEAPDCILKPFIGEVLSLETEAVMDPISGQEGLYDKASVIWDKVNGFRFQSMTEEGAQEAPLPFSEAEDGDWTLDGRTVTINEDGSKLIFSNGREDLVYGES